MVGRPRETAPPGHFTIREAANLLGVKQQALYNRMNRKTIPFKEVPLHNGQTRYYITEEVIEEELAKRGSTPLLPRGDQAELDELSERLNELSARQEELQQTVREILTAVREEAPMTRSDKQEPADKSAGQEERSELEIAYERADDPEFLELVGRDVRGHSTPDEHSFLRSPENVQLWRDALKAILRDLETQNIERKADAEAFRTACMRKGPSGKQEWFEYKASWDAWRGGAARFKRSVQTSLAEAKQLAQEQQQHDEKESFRQLLVESLNFLNQDEAITYKHTPARDALREKISSVLYKKNGSKNKTERAGTMRSSPTDFKVP